MPRNLGVHEEIRVSLLGTDGQPDLYQLLNEIRVERDLILVDLSAERFEGHEPFAHSDQHLDLNDALGGETSRPVHRQLQPLRHLFGSHPGVHGTGNPEIVPSPPGSITARISRHPGQAEGDPCTQAQRSESLVMS